MDEEKPAEEGYEALNRGPQLRGPIFWAGLLLLPIILSLFVSLLGQSSVQERPLEAPVVAPEVKGPREVSPRLIYPDRGREQAVKKDNGIALGCRFAAWEGLSFADTMKEKLGTLGRPYRLLPPGSMMTMDHNPARVNFDLDEHGLITRVWCG